MDTLINNSGHGTNKKYQKIIETAKVLFFKHGIKRITIEEICNKANVSKMTFYKFFENKSDLVKHLLQSIFNETSKIYFAIMEEKISFIEKIKKLIILKLEKTDEYGESFVKDLMEDNSGLLAYMSQMKTENDRLLADFLKKGQDEGVIRKTITPDLQLYYYDIFTEMFKSERFTNLIPNTHQRLEEIMNMLFYGMGESDLSHEVEVIDDPFIL
jgi:AcrR family transcriptional regulator